GRNTGFLTGRDIVPGLGGGHLGLVRQTDVVEHAQGTQRAGAPLGDGFGRVVHGGVNVVAPELDCYFATHLVGDVAELGAGRLFETHGDDLVFLLGTGTTHLHLARAGGLGCVDVFLGALVGLFGVDPQNELVQRQHGDRSHVLPVEGNASGQ